MATVSQAERGQLGLLLNKLTRSLSAAKNRLPWVEQQIRMDLDALRGAIVDLDRGYGPNLPSVPSLLQRERFRYLAFLEPGKSMLKPDRFRAGVRTHHDAGLPLAA